MRTDFEKVNRIVIDLIGKMGTSKPSAKQTELSKKKQNKKKITIHGSTFTTKVYVKQSSDKPGNKRV